MALLTKSKGVYFQVFTPALMHMLGRLYDLSQEVDHDIVITSANDGLHAPNSRHYKNEAVDVRSHNVPDKRAFEKTLQTSMGPQIFVLFESEGTPNAHYHIQVRKGHTFEEPV